MTGSLQTPRRGGRTETIVIAAGVTYRVDYIGSYARCVDATADLTARIDNTGEAMLWNKGKWYRSEPGDNFVSLEFINASGAPITLTYFVGWGTYGDDSITGNIDVEVQNFAASTVNDNADVTVAAAGTHTVAANTARRAVILQNLSTLYTFRVGAAPGAARGLKLAPEASMVLETTDEVKAYNTGAGNADLAVVELT